MTPREASGVGLGLRENWQQFSLLILINAFVGGMVGIERTIVPLIGSEEFRIASTTLITSFIVAFGVVKALANLVAGPFADRWGRKGVLVAGWLLGLPVPFILIAAHSWNWIVAANGLLGASQGFAWSMTVLMKIDLVGRENRGLAIGLNEFAGYLALGATAFVTGYLASHHALRPVPLYPAIGYAVAGLFLSILFVRDTRDHVHLEARSAPATGTLSFGEVFALGSFRDRNLFACAQAGLVNNLNDGMSWGILPLFFTARGLGVERIGILKGVYPVVWGAGQTLTGPLGDRWGRKGLIVAGMWIQAIGLVVMGTSPHFASWLVASVLLGAGTAMVYPTLIAAVSDASHPAWRARSLSVYRFWRDLGYAIGALSAGIMADRFGFGTAIVAIGAITFVSGAIVAAAMRTDRLSIHRGR